MSNEGSSIEKKVKTKVKRILLVDDRLGFWGTAKFLEYELNKALEQINKNQNNNQSNSSNSYKIDRFEVIPERFASNVELRLKTEPFDMVLLDLVFKRNDTTKETKNICKKCPNSNSSCYKKLELDIGDCVLTRVIRPYFPALPVVVLTAKKTDAPFYSATEMNLAGRASFFVKNRLKNEDGYIELVKIMLQLFKEYDEGLRDKIEIEKDRKEEELEAKNRDYMHTKLWQILTEKIQNKLKNKDDKFAVAFFDLDGMKKLNSAYGYQKTNELIKKFVEVIYEIIKKQGEKVFLGRYFRERGDEFLICWEKVESKQTIIEKIWKLIKEINDKETQAKIFEPVKGNNNLKLTASFGMFVYPDDLKWKERKIYEEIEKIKENREKIKEFAEEVYKQITEIPQKLKESAKVLGKNQVCYYEDSEGVEYKSPRVNVVIEKKDESNQNQEKENQKQEENQEEVKVSDIIELFKFIFGDLAFEFIEDNSICPIHAKVEIKDEELTIKATNYDGGPINSSSEFYNYGPISLKEFTNNKNYFLNLIKSPDPSKRKEALRTHTFMREIYRGLFHVLRHLAREHYKCERYFPRYLIQRKIAENTEKVKEEIVFYKEKKETNYNGELKKFWEGLEVVEPYKGVWVSERPSNKEASGEKGEKKSGEKSGEKGGEKDKKFPYKHSLMITLRISDPVAYEYLIMESGRNMVKFQQFAEGYFKGFVQMNPDGELTYEIIDLIHWDNLQRREEEKQKRIIVCRHELFSPVDPIVYNELVEIHRIRLDFDFGNEENSTGKNKPSPIGHIPLSQAIKAGIIQENSIVDKFVKKYFGKKGDIHLVVYAGSEMIGPSVQVAELAGYITEKLLEKLQSDTFVLLDIFAGSSATSLPSLKKIYDKIKISNNLEKAYIIRVDENIPEKIDYLEEYLEKREDKNKIKNKICLPYYEAQFDFQEARVKFGGEIKNYEKFLDELLENVLKNVVNSKHEIDIIIADPPHILSIPFLFDKGRSSNGKCFAEVIAKKYKVFIVYYAHKEQIRLCSYIRRKLKQYFDCVFRVTVAGEEMAVCFKDGKDNLKSKIEKALATVKEEIEKYYYSNLQGIMKIEKEK